MINSELKRTLYNLGLGNIIVNDSYEQFLYKNNKIVIIVSHTVSSITILEV